MADDAAVTASELALWVVAIIGGGIVLLMIVGSLTPPPSPHDEVEKIRTACDREYGEGTEASSDCQLKLYALKSDRDAAHRFDHAKAGAGL